MSVGWLGFKSCFKDVAKKKSGGWVGGLVGGWIFLKAVLSIAFSNQFVCCLGKDNTKIIYDT